MWIGGVLELVGGLMLLFGILSAARWRSSCRARWRSLTGCSTPRSSTFPSVNGGDAAILYCFIFLFIAAAGPGPWSVDAALGRKRAVAIADHA